MLSRVRLFVTPWTLARQDPLSMDFSRQERWSGLPCPPAGGLPDAGMEPVRPVSLALSGGFLPPSRLGSLKPEALRPLMIKMHTTSEKDGVSWWSSDWDSDLPMWRVQV